jgi:hypothetical protein
MERDQLTCFAVAGRIILNEVVRARTAFIGQWRALVNTLISEDSCYLGRDTV